MITVLLHAAILSAVTGAAQPPDGWTAFTGCWRAAQAPETSLLCVVPAAGGARLISIENGVTRETRIVAGGPSRSVTTEGCTGVESARWSADGERLFLKTDMKCGEHARLTTGIFAFTAINQWVSIEALAVGAQAVARTTHYIAVPESDVPAPVAALLPKNQMARETARYATAQRIDFADVKEALGEVDARAVEALIVARGQPFDLNRKSLLALADAGMPDFVVDALVAVSHPDVFEVRPPKVAVGERTGSDDFGVRDRYCDSFTYAPWSSAYDRYRCGRYAYDYFGYRYQGTYGYYSPFGYYNTPVIVIRDRDNSDSEHGGRATRDGYRRGSSSGSDQAQPRTRDSSSSRPSTGSSGSSSNGRSSDSSGGSGRTAKPRNN